MRLYKFFHNFLTPRVFFAVLAIALSSLVVFFSKPYLQGDESRYLNFSQNILNGFYANPDLKPGFLWNGPGYPILITPLKFLNFPYISYRILNVVLIILGAYFLFKFLLNFFSARKAAIISFLGTISHPFIFDAVTRILTESFTFFLFNFFFFFLFEFINQNKKRYLILSSISGGFLMLTKVFFAYVFLVVSIITLVLFLINRLNYRYSIIFSSSFLICIPYLLYTYTLTNKFFYWSDAGGSSLYSMSTPYKNEFGDWFPSSIDPKTKKISYLTENSRTTVPKSNPPYYENHEPFFISIKNKNGVMKDEFLKEKALENIFNHPVKYLQNIGWNISRIFFRAPFTDRELKTSFKIIFYTHGFILLVGFIFTLCSTIYFKNKTSIKIALLFVLVTLLGTSLLSAESRFLFPYYGIFISLIFIQLKKIYSWSSLKKSQL